MVEQPHSPFHAFHTVHLCSLVGAPSGVPLGLRRRPMTSETNGQDCGPQLFQTHMGRHKQMATTCLLGGPQSWDQHVAQDHHAAGF